MYEASIKRLEEAQRVAEANARQEKAYEREVDPLWAAVIEDYRKAIEALQAAIALVPPVGSVACPSCGGQLHRPVEQGAGWQGECTACHMRGPWRETPTAALEAWLSFADPVDTQNAQMEARRE